MTEVIIIEFLEIIKNYTIEIPKAPLNYTDIRAKEFYKKESKKVALDFKKWKKANKFKIVQEFQIADISCYSEPDANNMWEIKLKVTPQVELFLKNNHITTFYLSYKTNKYSKKEIYAFSQGDKIMVKAIIPENDYTPSSSFFESRVNGFSSNLYSCSGSLVQIEL